MASSRGPDCPVGIVRMVLPSLGEFWFSLLGSTVPSVEQRMGVADEGTSLQRVMGGLLGLCWIMTEQG